MKRALLVATCALFVFACAPSEPAAADLQAEAEARCLGRGYAPPARPFTSDQCSMWFDGGWGACCVAHDMDYWCGGTWVERWQSDGRLAKCVGFPGGFPMGAIMWPAVRCAGAGWLPHPARWGYGRSYPRSK